MTMSLPDLPPELHQRILSYLLSNKDVAALSLQCRALSTVCDMATRKKFHYIRILAGARSTDPAFELLLEILRNPSLGLYVRHIECHHRVLYSEFKYKMREAQGEVDDADMALLRKAVRISGVGISEDRLINMLLQRNEESDLDIDDLDVEDQDEDEDDG